MTEHQPIRVALWDAINEYTEACGGDTSRRTVSDRRMIAVTQVEQEVDRLIASAHSADPPWPEGSDDPLENVRAAIGLMRMRLDSGQGTLASAMCRLSLPMAEWLLAKVEAGMKPKCEWCGRLPATRNLMCAQCNEEVGV